jgi:hypothetical protein
MVALVETEESAGTGDAEADAEEPAGAAGGDVQGWFCPNFK